MLPSFRSIYVHPDGVVQRSSLRTTPCIDRHSTPMITLDALKIAVAALPLASPRRSTLSLVMIAAICAPPARMVTSEFTAPLVTADTVPAMQLRADTWLFATSTITITDD